MGHASTGALEFVGYHGTSSVHVPAIRTGIQPPTGHNFLGGAQLGEGFYTTLDYATAEYFAQIAVRYAGGQVAVLEFYVYNFSQMQGTVVSAPRWWRVPLEYITDYDYLRAPIDGFEPVEHITFNPRACGALVAR